MARKTSQSFASPHVRLYLLGTFYLERDGELVELPTRKEKALLAYLALYPQAHSREKLATLFWGDYPDENARRSLRMALSDLRKELGEGAFLTDRESVQLNSEYPLSVDAVAFLRVAHRVSQKTSDDSMKSELLSAISDYGGDLLADFYDDWIMPLREEYRDAYLDALLHVVKQYRAESDYAKAIEFAQKVLATDIANETAHQHLMFSYAVLGDRKTALEQYEICQRALRDELGVEPSEETQALFETIRKQTETRSPAARLTNLPQPLTSFVGREKQVHELKQLLGRQRLVTLTGAGGSGKTRLAIEVGREVVNGYPDGVWWVDLAPLTNEALVPQQVAKALGVQEQPQQELIETLIEFLRGKQLLLVIDNCEHLIAACAQVAETLLSVDTNLQVLATSREALGIGGETVWQVPTLAVPDEQGVLQWLMQYESIRLFVERAHAANAHFELMEQNAVAVTRICRRLDGIPLALELAAARIKVLSPEQIAARLDDRFNLLTSGSRTALPRQQTLRALIDWSYDLLSPTERVLLRRLTVFAGGWTLEAAEAVCVGERQAGILADAVLDVLSHLVDKSLVLVQEKRGEVRYSMLETIREYARERLVAAGEFEVVSKRHLIFFLALAEAAEPYLHGVQQAGWLERLELEHDNLRTAFEAATRQSFERGESKADDVELGLRLGGALWQFLEIHDHYAEGRRWLEALLEMENGSAAARAKVLTGAGTLAFDQADYERATELHTEAFALYQQLGDEGGMAFALHNLGAQALHQGDRIRASPQLEQSLALARKRNDRRLIAMALHNLGEVARLGGDLERAKAFYAESSVHSRALGEKLILSHVLVWLAKVLVEQGASEQALGLYDESLELARELGNMHRLIEVFEGLSGVAAAKRQPARGVRLVAAAAALREGIAAPVPPSDRPGYDRQVAALQAQLDETTFQREWAKGHMLPLEESIALALEESGRQKDKG